MIRSSIFNKILAALFFINFACSVSASEVTEDFLALAKAYFAQGQYYLAEKEAENALGLATTKTQKSLAHGFKGNLLLHLQQYQEAEKSLSAAFCETEDSQIKAGYANSLGVIYHKISNPEKAVDYFREALNLVEKGSVLALQIELNRLRAQPQKIEITVVNELLEKISLIDSLEERIRYYLNLASIAKSYKQKEEAYLQMQDILEVIYSSNNQEISNALRIELMDSLAELYEFSAELYEKKAKEQEALSLNKQALSLSEQASILAKDNDIKDIEDLLINIESRKGRIYQHLGHDQDAQTAFGLAVDYIQAIRRDIPITYEGGKSSFKEKLGPIYLAYVRQLLIKAGHQEGSDKKRTLSLARQTIEQIKQTELEDYLGGRCMFDGIEYFELNKIDEQAAVLYPIILQDRLELLLGTKQELKHYSVKVNNDCVQDAAKDLSGILQNKPAKPGELEKSHVINVHNNCLKKATSDLSRILDNDELSQREKDYKLISNALYQWLIRPIEQDLGKIKTLVVVPEGVLMLVPFAALFDGEKFLVEKEYALAISPGMNLLSNSKDTQGSREYRMLFAGLEIPGPVVEEKFREDISKERKNLFDMLEKRKSPRLSEQTIDNRNKNLSADIAYQLKNKMEESKLKYVASEFDKISENKALKIESLRNENFTAKNFAQQIEGKTYDIIHIASHGYFSSKTGGYLMTYDYEIKLDALRNFLRRDKDLQAGIQLLTFSACQTAGGDDRIPLGFAGAALKAEALSALGSLWPVSDKATAELMGIFYEQFTTYHDKAKSLNKAESLKKAQLQLQKNQDTKDPFYWSAFILVGSWL